MLERILQRLAALGAGERTPAARRTYRDVPREDGTPRYDDVWGG
jgi:hypothetical protein